MGQHHHEHHHDSAKNIKIAFFLNLGFSIIELAGGIFTNSVAILSDALHDLGDSISLAAAWYFQKISEKESDRKFSFGYRRFSLLGALINAAILIIGSVFVLYETIPRLFHPEQAYAPGMAIIAAFGIVMNGIAVLRLKKGASVNEKMVSLHLLEDVFGWVAVLIAGIVMSFADVPILDPLLSLVITVYILFNIYKNIKNSIPIFLQGVPAEINTGNIATTILEIPGIAGIHDIHLWTLDGKFHVLTVHVSLKEIHDFSEVRRIKKQVKDAVKGYNVQHITVETDSEDFVEEPH